MTVKHLRLLLAPSLVVIAFATAICGSLNIWGIALTSLVAFFGSYLAERLVRGIWSHLRTSWWDQKRAKQDSDLDWTDVYQLVSYKLDTEPLRYLPKFRGLLALIEEWPTVFLLILTFSVAFLLLSQIRMQPEAFKSQVVDIWNSAGFGDLVQASGNLTAYLALLASAATLLFALPQIRARVRAESRQNWISKTRELIARTIALAENIQRLDRRSECGDLLRKLDQTRIQLELMLNPSEKDHRLLMYLIQRMALQGRGDVHRIQDARMLIKSLQSSNERQEAEELTDYLPVGSSERPDFGSGWNQILYAQDFGDMVSYVMRLSHVVLKREWERVKHTR